MMKINKKSLIIFLLLILFIIFSILILNYLIGMNDNDKILKISYISMEDKSENLKFITQGIEQAEKDMKAKVNVCVLTDDNKIENQRNLLRKEIKNGADFIIISPIDYKELSKDIEEANKIVPIILMDSKVESNKKMSNILVDNYSIGKALAEEIIKNGNTRSIIGIVEKDINCSSLYEIKSGFMDEIKYSKNKCIDLRINGSKESYYKQIGSQIKDNNVDVLVSFSSDILEIISKIKEDKYYIKNKNKDVEIYGVGRSDKILSYVENEIIDAAIIKNDFNAGYLAVEIATDKVRNTRKNRKEAKIDFLVINKRNMYSEKNQKLIFPFIG